MPAPQLYFPHFGGFESINIHGAGIDVIETTGHLARWREDIDLIRIAGVRDLRYPAPWHRIELSPGKFDFSWMDEPMRYIRQQGLNPVIDLVHHTSFPDWLEGGFANPAFPELFSRFAEQFARRYEWVDRYTIFNEPLATSILCSYMGVWYPYQQSNDAFVRMGYNVAKAIAAVERRLRKIQPSFEFVYIDTCEHHKAYDRRSEDWVEFANARRFWILDLVLGKITRNHPLFHWLLNSGLGEDDLRRAGEAPVRIEVLGLDYYSHSEMMWHWNRQLRRADIRRPNPLPRGFARVAEDYLDRYELPVMLAETNLRGTVTDRLTWLRFMHEQSEALARAGADFRGFCWFPSVDSTDWSNLCSRHTGLVDPQGIWYLDSDCTTRFTSELSYQYSRLASGTARAEDLPAYRLRPPMDRELSGYLKLMSHWECWATPDEVEEVA